MLSILESLIHTITALINFVIHAIQSLINLFIKIPTYVNFLVTSINVLPIIIIPFAMAAISIYVVLFILGRK